jgi:hypothetical protein
VSLALGAHDVLLTVTSREGLTGTDDTRITVRDTLPPEGGVTGPESGACFGPGALPVTVTDRFEDLCDPGLRRAYDPAPGPDYSSHGDHHVTATATDSSGRSAMGSVDFTIDTVPPVARIQAPSESAIVLPGMLPVDLLCGSTDDDGARGDVVHEVLKLQGCVAYDGATYGDDDGLLSDESIRLGQAELCRIAAECGFQVLVQPEIRVEATDCGGNVGSASIKLRGSLSFLPGLCGP